MAKKKKEEKKSIFEILLSIILFPFKLIVRGVFWLIKTLLKMVLLAPIKIVIGLIVFFMIGVGLFLYVL